MGHRRGVRRPRGIVPRVVRAGRGWNHRPAPAHRHRVPADVELGFHLCYGDAGHQHFTQPTDAAILVRVANALAQGLDRPLNWLHLPVPRDRDDEAYYAPLADLRLGDDTELYLGLVHRTDGMEGTQRRIAGASNVLPALDLDRVRVRPPTIRVSSRAARPPRGRGEEAD